MLSLIVTRCPLTTPVDVLNLESISKNVLPDGKDIVSFKNTGTLPKAVLSESLDMYVAG